ncbi:peptide/nickel transport system permease protein [Glycomyces sambucus]|uniref:Peptide/nickel transport system permease protein n=1 Tax=Glycomyces sambucus TaxID=380244 RepID=A0A1G9FN39_9ACTN|nr:ABC transporter permease [Glycomyces sambucus]SDK89603.1 peptide/nickel transport system permease protein [Glycomyces sambucus]
MKALKALPARFHIAAAVFLLIAAAGVAGPLAATAGPGDLLGGPFVPPGADFLLGTDHLGRSVGVQLVHGIRTSLYIGLLAGVAGTVLGVLIGTLAGYRGGLADEILMGLTNIMITVPAIIVLLLLSISLDTRSVTVMGICIGAVSWPWTARAVRSQIASLRQREHVDIARLSGSRTWRIIAVELLPYMMSYIVMAFVIQLYGAILAEAALSLLGLGPSGTASLGVMLHWAIAWESIRGGQWWVFLTPTVFITAITFSLLLVQSSLDTVFNPRLRVGKAAR